MLTAAQLVALPVLAAPPASYLKVMVCKVVSDEAEMGIQELSLFAQDPSLEKSGKGLLGLKMANPHIPSLTMEIAVEVPIDVKDGIVNVDITNTPGGPKDFSFKSTDLIDTLDPGVKPVKIDLKQFNEAKLELSCRTPMQMPISFVAEDESDLVDPKELPSETPASPQPDTQQSPAGKTQLE